MRVLWKRGKSTVREVQEAMAPTRPLAYTTVLTVLRNLDKRGLVSHVSCATDRMYRYSAVVSSRDALNGVISNLTEKLFAGSAARLISHVIENDMCNAEELSVIRDLVLSKTKS